MFGYSLDYTIILIRLLLIPVEIANEEVSTMYASKFSSSPLSSRLTCEFFLTAYKEVFRSTMGVTNFMFPKFKLGLNEQDLRLLKS